MDWDGVWIAFGRYPDRLLEWKIGVVFSTSLQSVCDSRVTGIFKDA
jgi:hypothetical protein